MQDYEIVSTYLNGCAGSAHPIINFEEATLSSPEDYLKEKHGANFAQFKKEIRPNGQIVFTYEHGVSYIYEFTEL